MSATTVKPPRVTAAEDNSALDLTMLPAGPVIPGGQPWP